MRKALAQLVTCDAIALLPGWPSSRGANIERSLAFEMGMKVVMAADIAAPIGRESAATLVCASTANSGLNQANELAHSDMGARSSGRHPSIIRLRSARSSRQLEPLAVELPDVPFVKPLLAGLIEANAPPRSSLLNEQALLASQLKHPRNKPFLIHVHRSSRKPGV